LKIVLLRHGETELNNSGRFCGRTDCNITENGKNITARLASIEPFLSGFTAMYVSPLKRTAQTLIAIYPNCDYIVDERLIEISLGSWEGLEKTSVNQSDRKDFLKGLYTPPGAEETHEEVVNRIKSFFKYIDNSYDDSNIILCVTHNGVMRTIKQMLKLGDIKTKNSEYIIIDSEDFAKL
jgi:probable phosphoglycerate mutase